MRSFSIQTGLAAGFSILAAGLAATALGTASAATDPSAFRERTTSAVAGILGDDGVSRAQPYVDDATSRIIDAIHTVNTSEKSPRQILDPAQKMQLFMSRGKGASSLDLRPDQKAELATYVTDVIHSVMPILQDDGRQIDGTLSPLEKAKLDRLRSDTVAGLTAKLEGTSGSPQAVTSLGLDPLTMLAGPAVLTPGEFVLLTEIDYRSIAMRSR